VRPFYARLPQKINTFRIRRAFVQSVFPPRQVNYYAYSTSVLVYPTLREAECLCYTAASPRVSSSRTAIARSYKAFASSWELPTAVRPVLPSSPRALIM